MAEKVIGRDGRIRDKKVPEKKTVEMCIWKIPPRIRKRFKTACARKSITMRQALINFMREYGKG